MGKVLALRIICRVTMACVVAARHLSESQSADEKARKEED
jgi:hypothetical protein